MMNNYKIQAMTSRDYANYMSGSNNYHVIDIIVAGTTPPEAISRAKALYPNYHINEYYYEQI